MPLFLLLLGIFIHIWSDKTTNIVVGKILDEINLLDKLAGIRSSYSLISYSSTGMRYVWNQFLGNKTFKWVYIYTLHVLLNFLQETDERPQFLKTFHDSLYICNTVNNLGLIRTIFELHCQENLGNIYALVLRSPMRFISAKYMLRRLLKVIPVLTLPWHEILN